LSRPCCIGVDLGTSGCRVLAIARRRRVVAEARTDLPEPVRASAGGVQQAAAVAECPDPSPARIDRSLGLLGPPGPAWTGSPPPAPVWPGRHPPRTGAHVQQQSRRGGSGIDRVGRAAAEPCPRHRLQPRQAVGAQTPVAPGSGDPRFSPNGLAPWLPDRPLWRQRLEQLPQARLRCANATLAPMAVVPRARTGRTPAGGGAGDWTGPSE